MYSFPPVDISSIVHLLEAFSFDFDGHGQSPIALKLVSILFWYFYFIVILFMSTEYQISLPEGLKELQVIIFQV